MMEQDILDGLNEGQKEAVTHERGPLLVIAGPGTGKTLTIIRRILYLLYRGIKPHEIVALTFTNRAGLEMRERIKEKCDGVFIGTFHMFGLNILRTHYNRDFRLLTKDEQLRILKSLSDGIEKKAQGLLNHISRIKNFYDKESMQDPFFLKYEKTLKDINAFDIDDLIIKTIELLNSCEKTRSDISRIKYILIDEYQDINPSQFRLIKSLYAFTENICAVGDIDQAIYAFRGACIEHFLNFEKDFKGARYVFLKDNYRSSATIVDASQALIKHNKKRVEYTIKSASSKYDKKINVINVDNEYGEARLIVGEIEKRIGALSHLRLGQSDFRGDFGEDGYSFSDFAVLFRTNSQASVIEHAFIDSGIPYQLINDTFYEEIGEIIERLKEEIDHIDGKKTLSSILDNAFSIKERDALSGLKRNLLMAFGEYPVETALKKIIDELYLFSSSDTFDKDIDAVSLMTLHMSKGLEFKVVFIVGFEEGLIPYNLAKDDEDIEEERRLFYVGMTRAKHELFLICSKRRFMNGRKMGLEKSRFFYEIPGSLIETTTINKKDKPKKKPEQESLF